VKLVTFAIVAVFVGVAAFWIWYLFFNIFAVDFKVEPEGPKVSVNGTIEIKAVPLNALGKRAVNRMIPFEVKILEGKEIIYREEKEQGGIVLKLKDIKGKLKFEVSSPYSQAPSVFVFRVE